MSIKNVNIIIIDDDIEQLELIEKELKIFNEKHKDFYSFIIIKINKFIEGMQKIKEKLYDLVILDWRDQNDNNSGNVILEEIINQAYIPVIIYSAYSIHVNVKESFFCRIVDKGTESFPILLDNIIDIIKSELWFLRQSVETTIFTFIKKFWKYFYENWEELIKKIPTDFIKLIIINRLSFALSREKFISSEFYEKLKGNSLNYYIYPPFIPDDYNFEAADILKKKNIIKEDFYIILTPTCDFAQKKVENVLLAYIIPFEQLYEKEILEKKKKKTRLDFFNDCLGKPRYFFLPGTFLLNHSFVDFQNITFCTIKEIEINYKKITNLNYPIAQSFTSKFIKYYNRIGHDDPDLKSIRSSIEALDKKTS